MTAWEPSPARPFDRIDIYIGTAVLLLSWTVASLYLPVFRASGGRAGFYQAEFAPAVMSACGRGFVMPAEHSAPPSLKAFLDEKADTFNCADLPASVDAAPLNTMQSAFRYMMMSAALWWRVRGVSWPAVDTVLSLLFSASLTVGYVALRFAAGRTLSIAGVLLWLGSPMHLGNLPHLRDYSKTPFFIATLAAMAFVARERRTPRLAIAGAVFGLVLAVGFGMRTDVILNLAPFALVLFCAGARGLREDLRGKLACAASTVLVFTIAAWPILRAYGQNEGLAHVGVLGLTTPFDEPLGIRPAAYDFGYLYDDSYAAVEAYGHYARAELGTSSVSPGTAPYGKAASGYYLTLATTFPGDFLTRMTGAVIQVLNLPFSITYGRAPQGVTGAAASVSEWRTRLMLALVGTGPLVVLILIVIAGTSRLRDGLVAFGLLVFWAAYPFIQFHGRHTFHLEFLVIAAFMAMLSMVGRSAVAIRRGRRPPPRQVLRATALVLGLIVLSIAAIASARAIQHQRVRSLFDAYAHARTEPLTAATALFDTAAPPVIQQALIRVDAECQSPAQITLRYQTAKYHDFTRTMTIPAKSRTFAPVYAVHWIADAPSRFAGVDGPPCVRASRIRGVDHLLWMDATLTDGPDARPLNERVYIATAFPTRLWLKLAQWWPSLSSLG